MSNSIDINVDEIFADPTFNCRGEITPHDVLELARDIEKNGLLSPITVQPMNQGTFKYRLIAGHRRHIAYRALGRKTIPCMVREDLSETQARVLNIVENLQRKNLNPYQEAKAIEKFKLAGLTMKEVSEMVNMSIGWVQIRYNVLDLPEPIQLEIAAGVIKQEQIKQIASLKEPEEQYEAVKRIRDARLRGEKAVVKAIKRRKQSPLAKKIRKKEEVEEMQDIIYEAVGHNIGTKCLGWAAGYINDYELMLAVEEYAKSIGKPWSMPQEINVRAQAAVAI